MRRSKRSGGSSLVDLYYVNEEAKSNNWLFLFFMLSTFLGSLIGVGGEHALLSSIVAIISGVLIFTTIRELWRARRFKKHLLKQDDN